MLKVSMSGYRDKGAKADERWQGHSFRAPEVVKICGERACPRSAAQKGGA